MKIFLSFVSMLLGFERKTVARITARFQKIVAELEALEQRALEDVGFHKAAIEDHDAAAVAAQDEANQARKVADNIKALVS